MKKKRARGNKGRGTGIKGKISKGKKRDSTGGKTGKREITEQKGKRGVSFFGDVPEH